MNTPLMWMIILIVVGAFIGVCVEFCKSGNLKDGFLVCFLGAVIGFLIFAFCMAFGIGTKTRSYTLLPQEENLFYNVNFDDDVVFTVEQDGKEICLEIGKGLCSIEKISDEKEPYVEIKSNKDLTLSKVWLNVRDVVLFLPESAYVDYINHICAKQPTCTCQSDKPATNQDLELVQILIDAGYTAFFNGYRQGEDFRIESLNLKNYKISHDADKKEVYIMDK